MLSGLPWLTVVPLWRVQTNTAARLVLDQSSRKHVQGRRNVFKSGEACCSSNAILFIALSFPLLLAPLLNPARRSGALSVPSESGQSPVEKRIGRRRIRPGNALSRICLSVCLSVCNALTFQKPWPGKFNSYLVIQVNWVYQGHRAMVKVTGGKTCLCVASLCNMN